jgi:L-amino acid N-acyltransferase YncA
MKAHVRAATVNDAARVVDVLNGVIAEGKHTLFDAPFSEADERRFISSLGDRSALYVAELAGEIVGLQSIDVFLAYARSTRHVATMGTWLRADARGRGIGRLLAAESFDFARAHEYTKIVIHVLAGNQPALRFYRGLGFEDIGIARKHVQLAGRFHDEIYMEKHLE